MKHSKFAFIDHLAPKYQLLLLKAVSEEHAKDQVKIWKKQNGEKYVGGSVVDLRDYLAAGEICRIIDDEGCVAVKLKLKRVSGAIEVSAVKVACVKHWVDENARLASQICGRERLKKINERVKTNEEYDSIINRYYSHLKPALSCEAGQLAAERYRVITEKFKHPNPNRLIHKLFAEYLNALFMHGNRLGNDPLGKLMDRERANAMLTLMELLGIKQTYEAQEVTTFDSTKEF